MFDNFDLVVSTWQVPSQDKEWNCLNLLSSSLIQARQDLGLGGGDAKGLERLRPAAQWWFDLEVSWLIRFKPFGRAWKWWLCLHNALFPDKSISILRCLFYWDARDCWANSWVREGVWRVICCVSIIVHCLKTSEDWTPEIMTVLPLLPAAFFVRERSPDSGSTLQADVSDSSTANLLRAVAEATHEERSVQHWGGLIQRIQHHFQWSVSLNGMISGLCWCNHTRKCWSPSPVGRNWQSHLCPVVFVGSMKDMSLWLVVWDCVICCCIEHVLCLSA